MIQICFALLETSSVVFGVYISKPDPTLRYLCSIILNFLCGQCYLCTLVCAWLDVIIIYICYQQSVTKCILCNSWFGELRTKFFFTLISIFFYTNTNIWLRNPKTNYLIWCSSLKVAHILVHVGDSFIYM